MARLLVIALDGRFQFLSQELSAGSISVQTRIREVDDNGQFQYGSWSTPFNFTLVDPVNDVPQLATLALANDTGASSSDLVTWDASLTGTLTNAEGVEGLRVEFERRRHRWRGLQR